MSYGILLEDGNVLLLENGESLLLEFIDVIPGSAAKKILERILSELRTRITWESFGDCRNLTATRIVARYVRNTEQPAEREWDEELPGIILSPGPLAKVGGDLNCEDDVRYTFLLEIIDRDFNRGDMDRMQTWMRWIEQARRYFSEGTLRAMDDIDLVQTNVQEWLAAGPFKISSNAVMVLLLAVGAGESRDLNGG